MKHQTKDHFLVGNNPYGKQDIWLVDKVKFFADWIKREQGKIKYGNKVANKTDIEEIKNTNYKKNE